MKRLLIVLMLAVSATSGWCQFCLEVTDPCCDENSSGSKSYLVPSLLSEYYIYYDTGSSNNSVRITFFLDDQLYFYLDLCGCGTLEISTHPYNVGHYLKYEVDCRTCSEIPTPGCVGFTGTFKVYAPSTHACATDCP